MPGLPSVFSSVYQGRPNLQEPARDAILVYHAVKFLKSQDIGYLPCHFGTSQNEAPEPASANPPKEPRYKRYIRRK